MRPLRLLLLSIRILRSRRRRSREDVFANGRKWLLKLFSASCFFISPQNFSTREWARIKLTPRTNNLIYTVYSHKKILQRINVGSITVPISSHYTIYLLYVCTCVRCVMRGGGGGGSVSPAVKVKSLNPLAEGELNQ